MDEQASRKRSGRPFRLRTGGALVEPFSPFEELAVTLLAEISMQASDGAHDLSHILRVWRLVRLLVAEEGGDVETLVAATILHDCVHVPKDDPMRSQASRLAADRASEMLNGLGWSSAAIEAVHHVIHAHSFSAGVQPKTLEAKILQDADRLDALGHIGIARCFAVSGALGRPLYDPQDPAAEERALDDAAFALDHFFTKLLRLQDGFQTETGARLAQQRHQVMQRFVDGFLSEVGGRSG